tara:strand:+ start:3518 stop:4171 length:654 start_codon:yes stop_codon:yes gene_type:complete
MKLQEKDVKLTPPHVTEPDLLKALTKVYKDLNDLKESVHNFKGKEAEDTAEGSEGDIRVVKTPRTGNYTLQIRGDEGWLEDKTAKYVSLKGDVDIAQEQSKSTLPKSVGSLMPPPDYESDWTAITVNTAYTFTHNLNTELFTLIQAVFKDGSDRIWYPGVWMWEDSDTDNRGFCMWAKTKNVIEIGTQNHSVFAHGKTSLSDDYDINSGYVKLRLWK